MSSKRRSPSPSTVKWMRQHAENQPSAVACTSSFLFEATKSHECRASIPLSDYPEAGQLDRMPGSAPLATDASVPNREPQNQQHSQRFGPSC